MTGGTSAQLLPTFLLNRMLLRLGISRRSDRSLAIHDRDSTLNAIRLFRAANNVVAYRFEVIEIVAAKGWLRNGRQDSGDNSNTRYDSIRITENSSMV